MLQVGSYPYYLKQRILGKRGHLSNETAGRLFCIAADGTMLTGWHRIHNRFRYFGKQTGRMRINQTVNGRKINSKGVWTPVVVLDPGHSAVVAGGYEPLGPGSGQMKEKDTSGTQGVATGVEEYKLNLSIGLQLRTLLQKRGFKVIMTRTNSKVALSCIDRAKVANKANADVSVIIRPGRISSRANFIIIRPARRAHERMSLMVAGIIVRMYSDHNDLFLNW